MFLTLDLGRTGSFQPARPHQQMEGGMWWAVVGGRAEAWDGGSRAGRGEVEARNPAELSVSWV